MAFMVPEYTHDTFWCVEFPGDRQWYPPEAWKSAEDIFAHFTHAERVTRVRGWFCCLSAPGYLDCTDWSGPWSSEAEARDALADECGVDPDTGEELDDDGS